MCIIFIQAFRTAPLRARCLLQNIWRKEAATLPPHDNLRPSTSLALTEPVSGKDLISPSVYLALGEKSKLMSKRVGESKIPALPLTAPLKPAGMAAVEGLL